LCTITPTPLAPGLYFSSQQRYEEPENIFIPKEMAVLNIVDFTPREIETNTLKMGYLSF
jgi:hypothetical protein